MLKAIRDRIIKLLGGYTEEDIKIARGTGMIDGFMENEKEQQ